MRPDTFDHNDAGLQAVEQPGMEPHFATLIAQSNEPALGNAEPSGILRVNERRRPPLAFARGRGFGEGGVQKLSGGRGDQAEWAFRRALLNHANMVGQLRKTGIIGTDRLPVGREVETAIRMAETVKEMALGEGWLRVDPALRHYSLRPRPAGGPKRGVDQLHRRHLKPRVPRPEPLS